jgi:hypothetical protein
VETANDIPFFITHSNGVGKEKETKYTHLFMINAASFKKLDTVRKENHH